MSTAITTQRTYTSILPVLNLWRQIITSEHIAEATRGVHYCHSPYILVNASSPRPTVNVADEVMDMWEERVDLGHCRPGTQKAWAGEGHYAYGYVGNAFRSWFIDVKAILDNQANQANQSNPIRISRHTPRLDWPRRQGICWQSWELVWKGSIPQLVAVARSTDAYFGLAADLAMLKWVALQLRWDVVPVMICLRPHLYADQMNAARWLLDMVPDKKMICSQLVDGDRVPWVYDSSVAQKDGWIQVQRSSMVDVVPEPLRPKVATR